MKPRLSHFIFLLSLASIVGAGALFWFGNDFLKQEFPDVSILARSYPVVTYVGKGKPPKVALSRIRPGNWVDLEEVSKAAKGAVLVSEDWAFYQHGGYDPNQIKEAIKEDLEEGGFARGASTITQQVVRNVFLEKDKNLWRKLKELYLAVRLERTVSKNRILEIYFNIAEWGEGMYGIGRASEFYFNKPAGSLGAKEGAFLAMLLPSPKRYSQSFRSRQLTDYARSTIEAILGKMVQAKYITEEERTLERLSPLSFEDASQPTGSAL